jgi:carbamate kinase
MNLQKIFDKNSASLILFHLKKFFILGLILSTDIMLVLKQYNKNKKKILKDAKIKFFKKYRNIGNDFRKYSWSINAYL